MIERVCDQHQLINPSFQEVGQKRKIVVKIQFTPLSLSRLQNISL